MCVPFQVRQFINHSPLICFMQIKSCLIEEERIGRCVYCHLISFFLLIAESREHHRRYNVGTRHSGNFHSVPDENLVPQELPAFESATPVNVTVEKGQAAFLHCKIKNQGDYTVSVTHSTRLTIFHMFLNQLSFVTYLGP